MMPLSRQEKLVLVVISTVALVALTLVFWVNLNAQRRFLTREQTVIVQVDGAVLRPGIYRVKENTRVFEVLEEAGGTTTDANLQGMNLAQPVYDGQRIVIPSRKTSEGSQFSTNLSQFVPQTSSPPGSSHINVNTATLEELVALPGIGEVIAKRIIEYRETHGPFRRPEDLLEVKGIGPKKLEKIKDLVSF